MTASVTPLDDLRHSATAALFEGRDEIGVVSEGHIVVVPARTPHGFKGAGEDILRVVSVHPNGTVEQTNL